MKRSRQTIFRLSTLALAVSLGWQGNALAGMSMDDRMTQMERRVQDLETTVRHQEEEIRVRDQRISELRQGETGTGWFRHISMGGAIEIEAFHTDSDGFSEDEASDINLATAELGIEAVINDWTTANLVLLWEEEDGGDNDLTVDEATITFANKDVSPLYLVTGHTALPFGRFDTNMVSDPFTLDLGETKETEVLIGLEAGGFYASVYAFNGDLDKDGDNLINNGGVDLGFAWEGEDRGLDIGVGIINDIGDSDGIFDAISANLPGGVDYTDNVRGYALHAMFNLGQFNLIGEYVAASAGFDATNELAFNGGNAKPSAWNLEAGYGFHTLGHASTLAISYQKTKEALGLGLPQRRVTAALSLEVMKDTTITLEWAHDKDYASSDSALIAGATENGTGEDADTISAQLAIEF